MRTKNELLSTLSSLSVFTMPIFLRHPVFLPHPSFFYLGEVIQQVLEGASAKEREEPLSASKDCCSLQMMGDTLSKPITEKHTSMFETNMVRVGCCGMQGWRRTMEDAHLAQVNFQGSPGSLLLGVFDGHNGGRIALHCASNVPKVLCQTREWKEGNVQEALKKTYVSIDEQLMHSELRSEGGSTAVCVLVLGSRLYCANLGDSRAIVCRGGKPVPLSVDHKPTIPSEIARVERAGSTIANNRVNGTLALTRAIGDFDFKTNTQLPLTEQAVSPEPDVIAFDLQQNDDFIVLACDGIWDVMSNEEVCKFVQESMKTTADIGLICEALLDGCVASNAPGLGCDNMTVVVAQPKVEWKSSWNPPTTTTTTAT